MSIIPSMNEPSNPYMYCNYARRNHHKDVCSNCEKKDCNHYGYDHINCKRIREKSHK